MNSFIPGDREIVPAMFLLLGLSLPHTAQYPLQAILLSSLITLGHLCRVYQTLLPQYKSHPDSAVPRAWVNLTHFRESF